MLDGQIALYEVKPLSEVGKICHRAAEIIEERGWCQNAYASWGRVCAIGAINLAMGEPIDGYTPFSIEQPICEKANLGGKGIVAWNDAPGRTKAEVLARLRSVK